MSHELAQSIVHAAHQLQQDNDRCLIAMVRRRKNHASAQRRLKKYYTTDANGLRRDYDQFIVAYNSMIRQGYRRIEQDAFLKQCCNAEEDGAVCFFEKPLWKDHRDGSCYEKSINVETNQ